MTVYEFAIARAYAQLLAESKKRELSDKEKGTMRVLHAAVKRYEARNEKAMDATAG